MRRIKNLSALNKSRNDNNAIIQRNSNQQRKMKNQPAKNINKGMTFTVLQGDKFMRIKSTSNDLKSSKNESIAKVIYYKCENFEHYKEFRECS